MSDTISRKGVFIPDITVEMFRNASLESIEDLMASGEMEDILLPSAQPEPCEDAVSRQEVLEEFAELFMICNETLPNENGHHYVVEKELLITQKHIENLPSVTPKPYKEESEGEE